VLIIGNEILSGRTQDVNLNHLATVLGQWGVQVKEARVIPDDIEEIVTSVNATRAKYDYVFTTGGIGPTHDDITAVCIAQAFAVDLIQHPDIAARIQAGERMSVERLGQPEPKDTTHVAVVDENGMCVTMTHSLGMPSGAISDGLGFMYNGCMAVFDPRPGTAGAIAPGKSRFSSVCPTIAFKDDEPRYVVGAPGGTQIAMGVLQALLNVMDFDMSATDAVSAPRFSSTSNAIDIMNRIPGYVVEPCSKKDTMWCGQPCLSGSRPYMASGLMVVTSQAAPTLATMVWRSASEECIFHLFTVPADISISLL